MDSRLFPGTIGEPRFPPARTVEMNFRLPQIPNRTPHLEGAMSRRDFLARAGGGFGALALYSLLVQEGVFPSVVTAGENERAGAGATKSPLRSLKPLAPKGG